MRTKALVLSALFAALIFVSITFLSIPNGLGGIVHFGDALIFIAAGVLPAPLALPAAAIGAGLSNLVLVPVWFPFTIVIKPLMALCFSSKGSTILGAKRNVIAPFAAALINLVLYYGAHAIVLGGWYPAMAAVPGLTIQGGGSIVFYFVIAHMMDRLKLKELFFR